MDKTTAPTLLVSEVRSWCLESGSFCTDAVIEFLPGNNNYLDRVRYSDRQPTSETATFEPPIGIEVWYVDGSTQSRLGADDEERKIFLNEAIFTRIA